MLIEPAPPIGIRSVIGRSIEGRPIEAITFTSDSATSTVLILSSIHGNEDAGTPLVERLADHLTDYPASLNNKTVILVPCANPDGMDRQTRFNAHGVDLNRNFPADNFRTSRRSGLSPLSEPESIALFNVIRDCSPSVIITIHQPLACVDYDGPGYEVAAAMSSACGLPVNKLGAQPGSLGAYAGETLGIPIITLELPASADRMSANELWTTYSPALLVILE
ncbi:MAG: DUF2817 domain-containing protein [Planctomycetes bacterium]|nr:DUF2817 domain-containing protein [Planctomycetota bacterium]